MKLILKKIKITNDYPLIVSFGGKSIWKIDNKEKVEIESLLNRTEESCMFTTLSEVRLKPSSYKNEIEDFLNYFFGVCDVGTSPQSMWGTDDCDYVSLSLLFDCSSDMEHFDSVYKKTIEYFPKLLNSENYLEKIPNDKLSMNNVSLIEVAYPSTWIVDFIRKK